MAIDATGPRTRRAIIVGGLGALAATAAGAVVRPVVTNATDGGNVILGHDNTASSITKVTTTNNTAIWGTGTSGNGLHGKSASSNGVVGESASFNGVWGDSISGDGVYGSSNGARGVYGHSNYGIGVLGRSKGYGQPSVMGLKNASDGLGVAVQGEITDPASGYTAMYGVTAGLGVALVGESTGSGAGTWGVARGAGDGVYGESALGRGGQFKGKKAQVRLQPSAAVSHPASGARGDLFVDRTGRLWFCKGATTWKQIA